MVKYRKGQLVLDVCIKEANNIDTSSIDGPSMGRPRVYYAIVSVEPAGYIATTPCVVTTYRSPMWGGMFRFPLADFTSVGFLKIEVVRVSSLEEIGTSNRDIVVGRVRLPSREVLSSLKERDFPLVRCNGSTCKLEGSIRISAEVREMI